MYSNTRQTAARQPRLARLRLLSLLLAAALAVGGLVPSAAQAQAPLPPEPVETPVEPDAAPGAAGDALVVASDSAPVDDAAVALLAADAAQAGQANAGFTIKINTLDDEWSIQSDPQQRAATKCSLREALQAIVSGNPNGNQGCGAPSIANFSEYTFDMLPGTYLLKLGINQADSADDLPHLGSGKKVTIDGKGVVVIDGGGKQGRTRGIFRIVGGELVLKQITLKNGVRGSGGAVQMSSGNLQLVEATFEENTADNGSGTAFGGAIDAQGDVKCTKSTFKKNGAKGDGGAIHFGGSLSTIDRCKFIENWAWGHGGAIENTTGGSSHPYIVDSLFQENYIKPPSGEPDFTQDATGGGAIYNVGVIEIVRSQFYKNYTRLSKGGGAIYNQGDMKITDSALSYNEARIEGNVQTTFGGAIVSGGGGDLYLVRTSIHHNTAKLGGAIQGMGGLIYIVNTTISDNKAAFDGGIGNGFNPSNSGSEIHIIHSTVVRSDDNTPDPVNINSANNYKIYMGNSVIDSPCGSIINSYGGNVFKEFCARVPVDINDDQTATDFAADYIPDIGLEGLNNNGGPSLPEADFLSVKVDTDSAAVDRARDPQCNDVLVEHKDQIAGPRPNGTKCDAGAMEVGSKPPKYESTPAEGANIIFPAVFLGGGATQTQATLQIRNTGGGVINWTASIDEGWDGTFELTGQQTSGGLSQNQAATLTLFCKPKTQGSFYGMLLITTDLQDKPEVRYKLTCHSPNLNSPYAGAQQKPGALSAGQAGPGETTQVSAQIGNPGSQPLTANMTWKQTAGNVWQLVTSVSAVQAADGSATVTVPPGDTLNLEMRCKPQAPGLLSNILQVTTNDPLNPVLNYEIGCAGIVPPSTEGVALREASGQGIPAARTVGLALSPDGKQLLSGHWDDAGVGVYNVNQTNGVLALQTTVAQAGMSGIGGIVFSPDGKNVYWSSSTGDGVVIASRDPASGAVTPVRALTRSSFYICGFTNGNPPIFITCPIETMDGARGVAISPDGANVYVSGQTDGSLTVFARDPADGDLNFRQHFSNTVEGGVALEGAAGVIVARDGQNVYLPSRNSSTLVNFKRGADGRLAFVQAFTDTVAGVTGLGGAFAVAESPDGANLYVAGYASSAVAVFARNPADGFLTFVQSVPVGFGPYALEISHDAAGERLLVALWNGDGLVVLRRNAADGKLTPLTIVTEGPNSPTFNGVVGVTSSANDRQIYTALWADSAASSQASVRRLESLRDAPLVWNISPASAPQGAASLVLTLNGDRFYADSIVLWNGVPLPTTVVNDHTLNALVDAGKLGAAANAQVQVRTPPAGGGDSAPQLFAVTAPGAQQTPSVESLNPPAAEFGGQPLNVIVNGANFIAQSQALLNGGPVTTYYVSPSVLLVALTAADLTSPGPLAISVVNNPAAQPVALQAADANAANAIKTSVPVGFTTAAPNAPAQPSISSFAPGSLTAGAAAQSITVKGANFSLLDGAPSVAYVNGSPRATVVLDDKTLLLSLTAADLAAAGNKTVSVYTPGVPMAAPVALRVLAPGANPVPVAASLFVEYGATLRLTVSGSDFVNGAVVRLNGNPRPTTYVSPYQVVATVVLADLLKGNIVRVTNPGPGGGTSNGIGYQPNRFVLLPVARK